MPALRVPVAVEDDEQSMSWPDPIDNPRPDAADGGRVGLGCDQSTHASSYWPARARRRSSLANGKAYPAQAAEYFSVEP